jgi:hypothetical protein
MSISRHENAGQIIYKVSYNVLKKYGKFKIFGNKSNKLILHSRNEVREN